jgi:hypothetical protein
MHRLVSPPTVLVLFAAGALALLACGPGRPAATPTLAIAPTTAPVATATGTPVPRPSPTATTAATPTTVAVATPTVDAPVFLSPTPLVATGVPTPTAGPALLPATPTATSGAGVRPEPGYLDDRSTPEEVLRSYVDAVNRKEYARAYSYWDAGAAASQLPPFDQFAQGYAKTQSVQLTTGAPTSDVGAGQLYFSVPVALTATTSPGATQTFVGCYRLHLARPELQVVPPYHPLAIQSATVHQVPNDADASALLGQSCD